jgi:hypothetical protein
MRPLFAPFRLKSSLLTSLPRPGLRHPQPIIGVQLRHNSLPLQVNEIFSRRKLRETSHASLCLCQSIDRRDPQRVSIRASLEYVESIIHRRYLALPNSKFIPLQEAHFHHRFRPETITPTPSISCASQNPSLRFARLNPQGIFFGNMSKIFHRRHLRP